MVDGGKQAGVKVDDPDTNAWDKPRTCLNSLKGEDRQYATFCNQLRSLGRVRKNRGVPELSYVLAALQLHDSRWTEDLLRRVVAAWQGASRQNDIAERIAELCNLAVVRAVPGQEGTYTGADGPEWPKLAQRGSHPDDTLRLGVLWKDMKNGNCRFKEFAAEMVARGCGWLPEQVHALVDANRTDTQRENFPLPQPSCTLPPTPR